MEEEAAGDDTATHKASNSAANMIIPPGSYDLSKVKAYGEFIHRHRIDDEGMNILKNTPRNEEQPVDNNFTAMANMVATNQIKLMPSRSGGGSRTNPTAVADVPAYAVEKRNF